MKSVLEFLANVFTLPSRYTPVTETQKQAFDAGVKSGLNREDETLAPTGPADIREAWIQGYTEGRNLWITTW
jgi:hypothetical protein